MAGFFSLKQKTCFNLLFYKTFQKPQFNIKKISEKGYKNDHSTSSPEELE